MSTTPARSRSALVACDWSLPRCPSCWAVRPDRVALFMRAILDVLGEFDRLSGPFGRAIQFTTNEIKLLARCMLMCPCLCGDPGCRSCGAAPGAPCCEYTPKRCGEPECVCATPTHPRPDEPEDADA